MIRATDLPPCRIGNGDESWDQTPSPQVQDRFILDEAKPSIAELWSSRGEFV